MLSTADKTMSSERAKIERKLATARARVVGLERRLNEFDQDRLRNAAPIHTSASSPSARHPTPGSSPHRLTYAQVARSPPTSPETSPQAPDPGASSFNRSNNILSSLMERAPRTMKSANRPACTNSASSTQPLSRRERTVKNAQDFSLEFNEVDAASEAPLKAIGITEVGKARRQVQHFPHSMDLIALPRVLRMVDGFSTAPLVWQALALCQNLSRCSPAASKHTRKPTAKALQAIGSGISIRVDRKDRLGVYTAALREALGDLLVADMPRPWIFEKLRYLNDTHNKGQHEHEVVFDHQLHCETEEVVLDIMTILIGRGRLRPTFSATTAIDTMVSTAVSVQPTSSGMITRRQQSLPSSMSWHETAAETKRRRAAEIGVPEDLGEPPLDQHLVGCEIKTAMSGPDDAYFEFYSEVEAQTDSASPMFLQVKPPSSPFDEPLELDIVTSAGTRTERIQKELGTIVGGPDAENTDTDIESRIVQMNQYLNEPDRKDAGFKLPPHNITFNGLSFWVMYKTGAASVELSELVSAGGRMGFLEALCALAFATLSRHELTKW